MFDGILFDLDGTLWDTVAEITLTWNSVFQRRGVPGWPLKEEDVRACMGMRIVDIMDACLPGYSREEQADIIGECCRVENEYLAERGCTPYPGVEEMLEALSRKAKLFVVSNCQDGYIQAFFQGTGLGRYFADFECAGRTGKAKSENIAMVVERNGLKKPVYVGDTDLDRRSAEEAGVPFVHAAYGFGKVPEGTPAVKRVGELEAVLEGMGKADG